MISATRCVVLSYGAIALFIVYIVLDICLSKRPTAFDVTVDAVPAAESSEDIELPPPGPEILTWQRQVQLEYGPEEPLLVALRCLVAFWLVTTVRFSEVVSRFVPSSSGGDFTRYLAVLALSYALLWCDHLDHRSMVDAAVLPMMAWSVSTSVNHGALRGRSHDGLECATAHEKWSLLFIQSTVLFSAVLRCLGFLWFAPGSAERHALELIAAVIYFLLSGGSLLIKFWWQGILSSQDLLAVLPLFVSPLVHLYVSPPSAWDLAVALLWKPSWGLFFLLVFQLAIMYDFVGRLSQALGDEAIVTGLPGALPCCKFWSLRLNPGPWVAWRGNSEAQWRLHVAHSVEARRVAASTLPHAAAGLIVCASMPLCLVVPQPGWALYALLTLSLAPPAMLIFLTAWTYSTTRAPPPCDDVLMPTMMDEEGCLQLAQLCSLPFLLHLVYAYPVTRVPLAFLLPMAGWFGNCLATGIQSEDASGDLREELEQEQENCSELREQLHTEQEKCVGLQERLSNATERCRRLQKTERRSEDQADASRPGGQAHMISAANLAAAAAAQTSVAEAAMTEAAAARREATEANAEAAREKRRFAELKRESEVARGVSRAAVEQAAVLRKRGDEMERRCDAARADADEARAEAMRLSTDDAARRREALVLQASVDELGVRVEHHRTAAGTLRTRNTELKVQLKEQRKLADRAAAAAAVAIQEAEIQGAAAAAASAAELAAAPPPAPPPATPRSSHARLECSICLHDLLDGAVERLALPCAHVFHAACVEPWLRNHSECPECSTPVW